MWQSLQDPIASFFFGYRRLFFTVSYLSLSLVTPLPPREKEDCFSQTLQLCVCVCVCAHARAYIHLNQSKTKPPWPSIGHADT